MLLVGTMSSGSILLVSQLELVFRCLGYFPQGHTFSAMAMTIALGYLVSDVFEIVRSRQRSLSL
jgi:hypothetical protein